MPPSPSALLALDEPTQRASIATLGAEVEALPDPGDIRRWRHAAEARIEEAVAGFDAAMIAGESTFPAAERALWGVLQWGRRSLTAFVTVRGEQLGRAGIRADERRYWDGQAQSAIAATVHDPGSVELFLREWLDVAVESAATGYASLHADPGA